MSRNASGSLKMVGVALGAFAFTFALVPLYRIACEKVFGVRLEQGPAQASARAAAATERWVTVQFDGGVNSKLPWAFHPEQLTMRVQPGPQN
jgi:cytochrome c oxidase assembly protein subunit 11